MQALEKMMAEELVSIIIPVFNGQRVIGRTLASVFQQTYQSLDIIVVDDGSTDQTALIVEAAATRDPRIRIFHRTHQGLSATRNFAITQAQGSLIAPLDADDLWHPEKIALQVTAMQSAPSKAGVVYCWSVDIDENDFIIPPIRDKCTAEGNVVADLAAQNNFLENGSVPLMRRSCVDAVGGYDQQMIDGSEDWKFYLALAEICDFVVVPKHLVGYRRSSTSISRKIEAMARSIEHVEKWIMEKWPGLSREVTRQMFCNSNHYLAHKALTDDRFLTAAYYQFKSILADPSTLLARSTPIFAARFLARRFGIRRANIFARRPIPFAALQSERQ
jgi:glycosyltransferase involved in cell wall biosynthesis